MPRMSWLESWDECPICGLFQGSLYPETAPALECTGCGYMYARPPDEIAVTITYAREKHEELEVGWVEYGD